MKARLSVLVLLSFAACSTVELHPNARNIAISRGERFRRNLDGYAAVGEISSSCNSRPTLRLNIENCQNDLKNQAYEKGATLIILNERTIGNWWCKDCVKMKGTAYREIDPNAPPPRKPAESPDSIDSTPPNW
ncbi:MAG: hypothetical protein H6617_02665 [Bdellovibrionaceae bacterium]|nr:hypothetical protein [Pseudobdellovibrionaceae bacterium]